MASVQMDGVDRLLEDLGEHGSTDAERLVRELRRRLWSHRERWTEADAATMERASEWLGDPRL